MYEGPSFIQKYEGQYKKQEQKRIRAWKLFYIVVIIVGIVSLAVLLSGGLLVGKVFATPEGSGLEEDSLEDDALEEVQEQQPDEIEVLPELAQKEQGIPLVFVDAGHGGADGGCSVGEIMEKDINLAIAKLVQDKLKALGYQVVMSREEDTYISKEDRVIAANGCDADVYVSIHQNFSEDSSVNGMEVWYEGADSQRDNLRLAQLVHQQTAKYTGALERELRGNAEFHVTGETTMPACLVEVGFLSNAEERRKLVSAEYQEQAADGIVQGIEYYFHPKTMYLTFDDGPSGENTGRVLDILKERGIRATFFLVGENVRRYPEIAQRIAAEGHAIGVHCDSHDYTILYKSTDSYVQDFEKAWQTIYEVTGVKTNLFRFPGGSINDYNQEVYEAIIDEMAQRGYIYFDWNASLEDAVQDPNPEQLIRNGVETTLGRRKIVMLAHDVVYNTGICLNDLLDKLPEYEMKPLDESVEPICF